MPPSVPRTLRQTPRLSGDLCCFGITYVGFYKPGSRLPMRFRHLDMISASQNFLWLAG